MTDNVKALNLYTADMADGYINEPTRPSPPAQRTV